MMDKIRRPNSRSSLRRIENEPAILFLQCLNKKVNKINKKDSVVFRQQVHIADVNLTQAGVQGNLPAAQGMRPAGSRQIVEVKLGVKGQQAVWDFGVEIGDKSCDLQNFFFIDVSRHQKGAGDQHGRPRPLVDQAGQGLEILKRLGVGHPAQGIVDFLAPGFQIKLDQASGSQRQVRYHRQVRFLHAAVGFPTDTHDTLFSVFHGDAGRFNGMQNLGGRVAPEIADAGGFFVGSLRERFG